MKLTWQSATAESGSVTYTICQFDDNRHNNCLEIGSVTDALTYTLELNSLIKAVNQSYFVLATSGNQEQTSTEQSIQPSELAEMIGYFKSSNSENGDNVGFNVAVSGDGHTIVTTAPYEDSGANGVDGDQNDDSRSSTASGAAFVFSYDKNKGTWAQSAYLKASNPDRMDYFGWVDSLAMNDDGTTIAIGAHGEASGFADDPTDNSADYAGAVYIFSYQDSSWSQTAYIKDEQPKADERFGYSLAMNADGTRLAIGAPYADADSGTENIGAAFIYDFAGDNWTQTVKVTASNPDKNDRFGRGLALSGDGSTLAVGAFMEDSTDRGINGSGADNDAENSGAVYIFSQQLNWGQAAFLKASNADEGDNFGRAIALNDTGTKLAVSAYYESSDATGIDGDETSNNGAGSGAVYVFTNDAGNWQQQAYIKGNNTDGASFGHNSDSARDIYDPYWGDHFGRSVAFNKDGDTLAVGAMNEDSAAIGIDGDAEDDTSRDSGAVYVFNFDENTLAWSQTSYIKAPSNSGNIWFGRDVALDNAGDTLVVGAYNEGSNAKGINGDNSKLDDNEDNDENYSGAVFVY